MTTLNTEIALDIQRNPNFWHDLANLRAVGIRASLNINVQTLVHSAPELEDDALARLLSSASIFAAADDETSRDLAQQIAVFSTLVSNEAAVRQGVVHVLSDLGNFPGLQKLEESWQSALGFQTFLRRALLKNLNSVEMAGKPVSLTEFQLDVWENLKASVATGISAPTSAGKSFVVLEYLCEQAMRAGRFTALYVAPTRALLSEIQRKLERRLAGTESELRITTIPVPDAASRVKQIYVLTQERAQLLLSSVSVAGVVDLVIVDEAQAIGDDSRGMILQDALEKVRESNPKARFLFLAPGGSGFLEIGQSVGLPSLRVAETNLSPVVQNRISVTFPKEDEHRVRLDLVTARGRDPIGSYVFKRGFALNEDGKLAAVAQELGASGGSLVYATGAKNAEDLAALIALNQPTKESKDLLALSKFIEQHIHKQYSLAKFVRKGVAFHYGNMPSLLREGIENAFRGGHLDYLCCTTTLFQGVNLPARNVFIDTPTRGNRGEPLDEAALWNFAGRAGRLGEEIVGNVFLVNYENWGTQPLTERKSFPMRVAFNQAIESDFSTILRALDYASDFAEVDEPIEVDERITAAAGLILFRSGQGTLESLLSRPNLNLSDEQRRSLSSSASRALAKLGLPETVLTSSWMIDPIRLGGLLERLRQGVSKGEFEKLIPVNPSSDSYSVYNSIFRRLYKHLGAFELSGEGNKRTRGYVNHVTVTALKWMRGESLTQLVTQAVKYRMANASNRRVASSQAVIDTTIREMFVLIEQTIRFKLVQWAKAYVDLLRFALSEGGHLDRVEQVYDFSLALELGISTKTGRSLVEFGLSRITATAISSLITDSSLSPDEVRKWFRNQPISILSQLSSVILDELREKSLIPANRLE